MSHSKWREGCGRMLPLQRFDGNHLPRSASPFLPFLSWRVLSALTFFSCHSAWEGGNHLLWITPCSQANATALICSHVNTRIHQCWTKKPKPADGGTNTFLRCKTCLIKMKICVCIRDKSCKTLKRAGNNNNNKKNNHGEQKLGKSGCKFTVVIHDRIKTKT